MRVLRGLLPPARDNQRAADFLAHEIGADHASIGWVVVRPDTLVDGDVSAYTLSETPVTSLFRPGTSRMTNVAHAMADLATDETMWRRWRGTMPVVVDGDVEHLDSARTETRSWSTSMKPPAMA